MGSGEASAQPNASAKRLVLSDKAQRYDGRRADLSDVAASVSVWHPQKALRSRSRGPALGHGSDVASRWSLSHYRAEGYVGQVGASFDLTERSVSIRQSPW